MVGVSPDLVDAVIPEPLGHDRESGLGRVMRPKTNVRGSASRADIGPQGLVESVSRRSLVWPHQPLPAQSILGLTLDIRDALASKCSGEKNLAGGEEQASNGGLCSRRSGLPGVNALGGTMAKYSTVQGTGAPGPVHCSLGETAGQGQDQLQWSPVIVCRLRRCHHTSELLKPADYG